MSDSENWFADALTTRNFSLLYPPGSAMKENQADPAIDLEAQHDLGVDFITAAFTADKEKQVEIRETICLLNQDPEVIRYRQDILEDLLAHTILVERLESLFPVIDSLVQYSYRAEQGAESLQEVIWRMGELQNVLDCIYGLDDIFASLDDELKSKGLRMLQDVVRAVRSNTTIQHLAKELPEIMKTLRACVSITIGVNLDSSLRPVQAVLLSVHDKPFTDQSLLNKLFGFQNNQEGIAPLHSVPQRAVPGHYAFPISSELGWAVNPMMVPLFADLSIVLKKTTEPIAKRLRQYSEIQGRMFITLRHDLLFYLGAVRFIRSLQQHGLPVCRPDIAPLEERLCLVRDSYNTNLALRSITQSRDFPDGVVTNDVSIGPEGRILILTGPNQGGKTTYMQGIGIVQLLAQAGCFVPGTHAEISPVEQILTHFPLEEQPEAELGRFGEEALRLGRIFDRVSRNSLVLLNESLSSTSSGESLYLAQDVVRILRRLGARVVYSTHMHELAGRVDELNESVEGDSKIISIVSSPLDAELHMPAGEIKRTYKVQSRPPLGKSYAREIAARYGISYEQLENLLEERGGFKKW
jgi:DNA mismatch repair ATPase MutS